MSAGGTNLTAAAGSPSAMGVMDVLHDNSMYHALPSLREGHVHCAQLEDGFECIMQTVPIVASLSRHRCKGSCGRHIHAQCGHQLGDNEMDRVCYRCCNENEHGGKRPRITTTSTIVPDVNVSPRRAQARAEAAQNMQKQGRVMQRRSQQAQGGHVNLPLGLVVRHNVDKYDRTKLDRSNLLAVVVDQPGATVYTIATHAGYLEKNISRSYLGIPSAPIDPTLVKLTGVLEKFKKGELKPLSMRLFARGSSLTGGPGMINCSCGKTGKCTSCKCAKAGRRCNSSCRCSRFSMCTNMEAMEALDEAILERRELDDVNVALTRSELA